MMKLLLWLLFCFSPLVFASDYCVLENSEDTAFEEFPQYICDIVEPFVKLSYKTDKNGNTLLMRTSCYGTCDELHELLANGNDVIKTINQKNDFGDTALSLMCAYGTTKRVDLLLKYGADVSQKNGDHYSPLMLVCKNPNLQKIKLLIDYGADVNEERLYGEGHELTPLFMTCINADAKDIFGVRAMYILIKYGANVNLGLFQENNRKLSVLAYWILYKLINLDSVSTTGLKILLIHADTNVLATYDDGRVEGIMTLLYQRGYDDETLAESTLKSALKRHGYLRAEGNGRSSCSIL